MSKIRRSPTNVTGDMTVNQGDVIITEAGKGVVMTNPSDDDKRLVIAEDAGQDVLEIDDA